jgi:AraC family transcriptional regulator, transcriptional activator of pobA
MKNDIPVYHISSLTSYRKEDIVVSRFGVYSRSHQHLHYPHRHNFYHIVMFTEGSGTHAIDFENFVVKPWQIYFMVPGQVHSWSFEGAVDGYVVNFSSTYFQSFLLLTDYLQQFSFMNGVAKDAVLDVPVSCQGPIGDIFEEIIKAGGENKKFSEDLVRVLLLRMFMMVSDLVVARPESYMSSYNYTVLKNFQQLIERNFATLRLPKEYAELLYITPNHLNALCKDVLGIPAGEVIRNRILLEAKRLLVNLDLSITEISNELNFSDNSYFTKFFKKYVGITPEEFRKKTVKR